MLCRNAPAIAQKLEQAEYRNTLRCADVNPSVSDHWGDEFIVGEVVTRISGLIGIVELIREVRRVVSVKDGRAAIFDDPNNAIACSAGGNAGRCARIRKAVGGMRRRAGREQPIHDGKRLDGVADGAVINRAVEVAGLRVNSAGELSGNELVDVIGVAVEFAHVVAIEHVDIGVFPGAYSQVTRLSAAINEVRKQERAAGTKVCVAIRFGDGVQWRKVIQEREGHSGIDLGKTIAVITV